MDEVSPFEPTIVGAVGRHWRFVLAVVVAILIPAGLYAFSRPASYAATAALTVSDPRGQGVLNGAPAEAPDRYVSDQLVVFSSAALGDRAAKQGLHQNPPLRQPANWYLSHTSASAVAADNNVLSVTFTAPSSSAAMAGVRAVVAAYRDVVQASVADQAKAVLNQLNSSIGSLDAQLKALPASDPANADRIQQLNLNRAPLAARRADVAAEVVFPGNGIGPTLLPSHTSTQGKSAALRILVLALAFGLLLGVGLAYVRSYRKRIFTSQRDPELILGAPLLIDVSHLRTVDLLGLAPAEEDAARRGDGTRDVRHRRVAARRPSVRERPGWSVARGRQRAECGQLHRRRVAHRAWHSPRRACGSCSSTSKPPGHPPAPGWPG